MHKVDTEKDGMRFTTIYTVITSWKGLEKACCPSPKTGDGQHCKLQGAGHFRAVFNIEGFTDLINLALPVTIPCWDRQVLQKCNAISGFQKVLI
jgi:hypothetical protein